MKTFMANDKVAAEQRKWYIVDAANEPLGLCQGLRRR